MSIGRFVSADPFPGFAGSPQSLNRYAYAGNNPVNRQDPTGMSEEFGDWDGDGGGSGGDPIRWLCGPGCGLPSKGSFVSLGDGLKPPGGGVGGVMDHRPPPRSCERQTSGGLLIGSDSDDTYGVQLRDLTFTVRQRRGQLHIGAFPVNAVAMVWDWMTVDVVDTMRFGSRLYHHEAGHIIQQSKFGFLPVYRVAAFVSYTNFSHDNILERGANCYAGLPWDWDGSGAGVIE